MLAIRLQRVGRKGLPVYRIAVQEAQRHPSSGRVVAYVGSYNPHTKVSNVDAEKVALYLSNGAQPTPRVVSILTAEKISMPAWVKTAESKNRTIRNPEKLRKNRPAEELAEAPVEEAPAEPATDEVVADEPAAEEAPAEEVAEVTTDETPEVVEEPAEAEKSEEKA